MRLLKALFWFYFQYKPEGQNLYPKLQVEKLGAIVILSLLTLFYFFLEGILEQNSKQIWGCGIGVLFLLIPAFILSMALLGKYDEFLNSKNK